MSPLNSWTSAPFAADGRSFPTYRKGSGPGVVVIHEMPGMTPDVIGFGEEVVTSGFTVVMPNLFGTAGRDLSAPYLLSSLRQVCVSSEFTKLATGVTTPVAGWLRALARALHAEVGGPGVGAIGMCFTGGFALAMMVDESVAAPVVAQPSAPFAIGRARSEDLNLNAGDLATVRIRAAAGCPVLGLRYAKDGATGKRFDVLRRELGDNFEAVEFPGRKHSTLTAHRQQEGVDRVLTFLHERLDHP